MRNIKFLVTLAVIMSFSSAAFSQSGTATASVTIVTPITLAKTVDMNFGNIAASPVLGTAVLTPAGTRSKTGGVTLPAIGGTVTAATFTVSGMANYTYTITLPVSAATITSGANTMTVNTWTSTPTPTGTIGVGGNQVLTVGATLNVGVNQAAGTYVSAVPFSVTVNYN